MSYLQFAFSGKEEEVIPTLYYIFMHEGLPTEDYKEFLLDVVLHIPLMDKEMREYIQQFLMRCEEGVYLPINGIICVPSSHPRYEEYLTIMNAVYGDNPIGVFEDKANICNMMIVHLIQMLEKGCTYRSCYRKNPLHKELMHSRLRLF